MDHEAGPLKVRLSSEIKIYCVDYRLVNNLLKLSQ